MIDLNKMQEEMLVWQNHNFPTSPPYIPLLGAVEELGELAHAHIKSEQGIRGTKKEHLEAKIDAIADAFIFLVDYCNRYEINLEQAIQETWDRVKQRNWKKYPKTGFPEASNEEFLQCFRCMASPCKCGIL